MRKPKTLADLEPGFARRVRSAWFDPEVASDIFRTHFRLSSQWISDLRKELGPRKLTRRMAASIRRKETR